MADLPQTLLKLSAVREQHRDWHKALDDLLEEVDQALKSKENVAATSVSSPPTKTSLNFDNQDIHDQTYPLAKIKETHEPQEHGKWTQRSTSFRSLQRPTIAMAPEFSQEEESEENNTWCVKGKKAAAQMVGSEWFEFAIGFLIFLNLISIGVEAELSVTNQMTFDSR